MLTNTVSCCAECGAILLDGKSCEDRFHQMGVWEFENPSVIPEVHHLMVLCYHLQHPSLYSPEGLNGAKSLLVDFLERGITPADVRRRDRAKLDSGKRKFKIRGTESSHGAYEHPVQWSMTAVDVTASGADNYCANVKAWARSVLGDLRLSRNLPPSAARR